MKKITLCAAALALSVGLLAGCASSNEDAPSNEEPNASDNLTFDSIVVDEALQAEFKSMRQNNLLDNVFNTYVVASYVSASYDGASAEGDPGFVSRNSFSSAGRGITHQNETSFMGETYGCATYNNDVDPFAVATTSPSDGSTSIDVYPAGEYMASIVKNWLINEHALEERVVSITTDEETNSKVFVTRAVYDAFNVEYEFTYVVDAETGFITELREMLYDMESPETPTLTVFEVTYNEPLEFTTNPVADVFGGEDLCKVTVVFNPGQDSEEVQTYSVVEGTRVYAYTSDDYLAMYGDAECTEELEEVVATGDEITFYVKLA